MKNEMFKMLKIYEQDFPEKILEATKTEVIAHYYQTLNEENGCEISICPFITVGYLSIIKS